MNKNSIHPLALLFTGLFLALSGIMATPPLSASEPSSTLEKENPSAKLNAQTPEDTSVIPRPSAPQLRWQRYEQIMFVCIDPCTWQNREYDNHSTPLDQINPSKLDTDQWCETARSWGAKLILFVAKHTGGFCWWQTDTTDYGIKNTPWKDGKGDVLAELSASCKKYGLDLGIYVYPGDETWGAGIGSGGKTADPAKQEGYNKVFRRQLTETLSKYGPIREVWFDGSCIIDVSDILKQYASDAVILQDPQTTIRWVGNEDGIAPDPNWYTLSRKDLDSGVSTAQHSTPDGDTYAPVEVDVPFLKNGGHKWFWGADTDHLIAPLDKLMNLYYSSVGRGAVLLLNSTPDTSGLIPASHVTRYKEFGAEIARRFAKPLASTSGNKDSLTLSFKKPTSVNHVIIQEDLAQGQRILSYIVEGSADGKSFSPLCSGQSVGQKKIDFFTPAKVKSLRLTVLKSKATPHIANFAAYNVTGELNDLKSPVLSPRPVTLGTWDNAPLDEWIELTYDITPHLNAIGEYDVILTPRIPDPSTPDKGIPDKGFDLDTPILTMYGREFPEGIKPLDPKDGLGFRITRSQQTLDEFPTKITLKFKRNSLDSVGTITLKRIAY